jgi:enediyne biosynthesis protein E2
MSTVIGSLRRLIFAPSLAKVGFEGRGFPVTPSDATRRLEAIPQSVICGFEWGMDTRTQDEVERRLGMLDPELRGFGYEGATMAFTILDAMGPGRGTRTHDLLSGPGEPHIFLAYIGIGFAMARLPRVLWRKVLPDLTGSPFHPTMSWLAVDGYGFDRAYFDTRRWVDRQQTPAAYPWQGAPDYFQRAVDQGIGRALWFIHGGGAAEVAAAVARFAGHRQPDLWSGVGLAATFAGGSDAAALATLCEAAGRNRPELALGAVFAATARTYAGFVPDHTQVAVNALADLSVDAAVELGVSTATAADATGPVPPYELWRGRIRGFFAARVER